MSELSLFLKQNKIQKENQKYVATKSLVDSEGTPLEWDIKHLTTKDNEIIRDSCMKEVQVTGKQGVFRPKLDTTLYIAKMIVASVANPSLDSKELQDSYGVLNPVDLLYAMVDDPGEYQDFATFVQDFNGFSSSMDDKVDEAKN